MLAAMYGARESISCLLDVGADPNILSQPGDTTALSGAITASRDPTTVEMLSSVTTEGLPTVLVALSMSQIKIADEVVDSIWLRFLETEKGEQRIRNLTHVLMAATTFGNIATLKILVPTFQLIFDQNKNPVESLHSIKHRLLKLAVESDSVEAVQIMKNIWLNDDPVDEDIVQLAHSRGMCNIIKLLDPGFQNFSSRQKKLELKSKIVEDLKNGKSSLDVIPIANPKPIEYFNRLSKIIDLLPPDMSSTTICFEDLLKFHLPPVHYEEDEMCLLECRTACGQQEYCNIIRKSVRIAEYIQHQIGAKDQLFKFLQKPMVVGSMKENTKLFCLDEIDITLQLGDELSQYLFFSEEDHQVRIRDIPENHPLGDYKDDNQCLDLRKYSETYFILVHTILTEMEKNWPDELQDIDLENFTTKFIPCLNCMDDEMSWIQVFRCRQSNQCQKSTSPCVSVSKIGI